MQFCQNSFSIEPVNFPIPLTLYLRLLSLKHNQSYVRYHLNEANALLSFVGNNFFQTHLSAGIEFEPSYQES